MTFGSCGLHTLLDWDILSRLALSRLSFIARFLADLFLISFLNILEMIST
jgi:hypothetical protein